MVISHFQMPQWIIRNLCITPTIKLMRTSQLTPKHWYINNVWNINNVRPPMLQIMLYALFGINSSWKLRSLFSKGYTVILIYILSYELILIAVILWYSNQLHNLSNYIESKLSWAVQKPLEGQPQSNRFYFPFSQCLITFFISSAAREIPTSLIDRVEREVILTEKHPRRFTQISSSDTQNKGCISFTDTRL